MEVRKTAIDGFYSEEILRPSCSDSPTCSTLVTGQYDTFIT